MPEKPNLQIKQTELNLHYIGLSTMAFLLYNSKILNTKFDKHKG